MATHEQRRSTLVFNLIGQFKIKFLYPGKGRKNRLITRYPSFRKTFAMALITVLMPGAGPPPASMTMASFIL
jgi:hypothetical protein